MKKRILIAFFVLMVVGCNKPNQNDDPCSQLVNGIYQYPTEPGPPDMTAEEGREYYNIPENVLPCLSTGGLLTSCLNHQYLAPFMLMAGSDGLQSGYDLMKNLHCRGIKELETRSGALDTLMTRYILINTTDYNTTKSPLVYGSYKYYTYCLEVFLSQEVYLKNISTTKKIELLTDLFVKQNFRNGQPGVLGIEGPSFVMARLMYYSNYQPFLDIYNQDPNIRQIVTYGTQIVENRKILIISNAQSYLNQLANK